MQTYGMVNVNGTTPVFVECEGANNLHIVLCPVIGLDRVWNKGELSVHQASKEGFSIVSTVKGDRGRLVWTVWHTE